MKPQNLKPALRELSARSEKIVELAEARNSSAQAREFARGDYLRAAAAKFSDRAPALDEIQNPFQVAPRGREWRTGFLRWARKRGLRALA